jgi:hypothetical protein
MVTRLLIGRYGALDMVGQEIRDYRLFPALKQNLNRQQHTGDGEAETHVTRQRVK